MTNAKTFQFKDIGLVHAIIARYPVGRQRSAILPLLTLAQKENGGFITINICEEVAHLLNLHVLRVHEVATFYTMFRFTHAGKHPIDICTTTPCWLRGSDALMQHCTETLHVKPGVCTKDGLFSFRSVECLGACVGAPVVQIGDDYYENLTPESLTQVLDNLRHAHMVQNDDGEKVK